MKLSVSLPESDVAIIDSFVERQGLPSRSAAVREAVARLQQAELEDAYSQAWQEWDVAGEARVWDEAAGDGLA